jgi:NAD(P)-dependent dehydrogenase (short-subunit alcohol dehydrogenase family)
MNAAGHTADRPFRLDGKVVMVTGASRGIGRAVAHEVANAGAAGLILAARSTDALEAVRHELCATGCEIAVVPLDVTDDGSVEDAVRGAVDRFGRIDTLVNNVGGASFKARVQDIQVPGWRKVIDLNVTSVFLMCRAVVGSWEGAPDLRGRSVVTVGSTASVRGRLGLAAYSAGKHALVGLTKTLARELAPLGARANLVAPHLVETDLTRAQQASAFREESLRHIPAGRWAEAEEVARAVRFLASDAASYITGTALLVDGGHES